MPAWELPTDRCRPRTRDGRGDRLAVRVPGAVGEAVERLAERHGATPYTVLLAAFYALLGRYTGQRDLAVGTVVEGRTRPETEPLIGFFANTVVLRGDLSGEPSFDELVERVRRGVLEAFGDSEVPFERIVEELAPERDPSRNPLFQVMFETRPDQAAVFDLPGLDVRPLPVSWPVAKFDLMLSVRRRADGALDCAFEYATALLDRATVRRLAEHYRLLLTAAVTEPGAPVGRLEPLPAAERRLLTEGWRDTAAAPPEAGLPALVAARAARTPDAPAVVFGARTLSYAEFDSAATRLARRLRALGVRAETPVAVRLRRGPELVTAVLGVLRAGGVYVPIDPEHPRARREFVLADSGARVLVHRAGESEEEPPPGVRALDLDAAPEPPGAEPAALEAPLPEQAAYVIYTSGSTGRPKGVVVPHRALANRVMWTVREHRLGPEDRVLQKTTVSFDASVWEFLAPLVAGGTVVVAAEGVPSDPAAMAAAVAAHGVTVLQLVPSVLRALVREPGLGDCLTLRHVFSAGEPLSVELAERLLARLPVRLTNTYGPTECAIDVTSWTFTGEEPGELVPIGTPIDNTRVLVLDSEDRLAPIGVPGELCVAGTGLGRGYAGRGDLTAERFTPHPFPSAPGERIYRTGDRARRLDDGRLEYLGRLDGQVKVRSVRVEPAEIESVLGEHPSVAAAAVAVDRRPGQEDAARLVAHVVPAAGGALDMAELRAHLVARLPAPLVPSLLLPLGALPLTASGKIDRAALPAPGAARGEAERVPPRGPAQTAVAAAFAEVLGVDAVGADDDFFALGGHSLLATRLVFRLRVGLGARVPVAEVFARRTVAALAELVAAPGADAARDPLVPVDRGGPLPLSSAQARMWFLDQLDPGGEEYLVPLVLRLRGALDEAALVSALDGLAAAHEVLRTRYPARDGAPTQVIDPPGPLPLTRLELAGRPAEVTAALARETARPFDLAARWPLRATLARLADDEHLLLLTAHHIAVDGWSWDLLLDDLSAGYRAGVTGTAPPAVPALGYADFAAWQRRWDAGSAAAEQLAYWTDRLADLDPLELPTDRPRPVARDARGALLPFEIPDELADAVTALARRQAVTPFVVLLAAFDVVLSRWTDRTDVAVGTPAAGRSRQETEGMVGVFVNTVVLRTRWEGDPTFLALLGRVREDVAAGYSRQDLPFERLVDALRPERDLARNPLFQVMFELQQGQGGAPRLEGLAVERVRVPWHTAKFDVTFSLARRPDGGLRGLVEYAVALFDEATVRRLSGHFLRVLAAATAAPELPLSRLPSLTDPERRQLLVDWQAAPAAPPALSVPEAFARRAAERPDAPAVVFGAHRLTYRETLERAEGVAALLRARGIGRGRLVAVALERGIEVVPTLLGVLRAGAAYLPVDPEHPAQRLAFMLDDARADLVVTVDRFARRLERAGRPLLTLDTEPATAPPGDRAPYPALDELAYVIYTSGSTGRPKGVLIEHGSYAQHCRVIADSYDVRPGDRVVLLSALTFDVAMDQTAATLLAGGTVVVADPKFWSPAELPARIAEHRVTHMEITPAYYREMMHHVPPGDPRLGGLRLMNVGSDVVTVADANRWLASGLPGRFLCNYGPTEATVTCLLHPVPDPLPEEAAATALPIGRPVPGTRAHVLDRDGAPTPVGVPGELHLGGLRLARGYLRRPALTAERFVPDPFSGEPGARLYRTGDLVRYRADGAIEFLGRLDQQVKLRGFRIELGEIEAVLAEHPTVRAVSVVARDVRPGDRRLVAYPVAHEGSDGKPLDLARLRRHVAERLPEYMVPSLWEELPALPLTPSKKVDRRALPAPRLDGAADHRPHQPPRDPAEEVVAEIWADVLGLPAISVHDDVFALGAHSLLVTRVLARVNQAFALDIPLRRLFDATTVAALAEIAREAVEEELAGLSDDEVGALLATEGER
ncbi:amino acid adenylation domain-containing protein [Streptomyces sedi]|uniref:amino acid adenylation domain-containing protein n=1 Tax=Streptomyces sedi TaxID=555059 RepID=UPI0031F1001C